MRKKVSLNNNEFIYDEDRLESVTILKHNYRAELGFISGGLTIIGDPAYVSPVDDSVLWWRLPDTAVEDYARDYIQDVYICLKHVDCIHMFLTCFPRIELIMSSGNSYIVDYADINKMKDDYAFLSNVIESL